MNISVKPLCLILLIVFCSPAFSSVSFPNVLYVPGEYSSIQSAIDAASAGDVVLVSAGFHSGKIDFKGKDITVRSEMPDDPEMVAATIIDAGGSGSGVTFANGESREAVLRGFTITGGVGTSNGISSNAIFGGGIYCNGASPTICDNIITGNVGPTNENELVGLGAGIACFNSNAIITRNIIKENSNYGAGAIFVQVCNPLITNNLICNNTATYIGGVYLVCGGELINNTLIGNSASEMGGNICALGDGKSARFVIKNNIVCDAGEGGGIYVDGGEVDYDSIRYNNVWNNTGGNYDNLPDQTGVNGNISVDPGFVDEYHISNASPCYDAGDESFVPYVWQRDIDGQAAVMNLKPDMGADEVVGNAHPVSNAGDDQYFDSIPEAVVLDGSGSFDLDQDDIITYEWVQTDGAAVTLTNGNAAVASFEPSVEDVYLFELTVSDGSVTTAPDEVMIVVGNRAPVSNAGADFDSQLGEEIVLNGLASYDLDEGDVLSYSWTQVGGESVDLTGEDSARPQFTASSEGEYVFQLIVSDGMDQSEPDTVTVTVRIGSAYDSYGYQWIDSDNAFGPQYYWFDIQQSGTEITGLANTYDSFVGPFPIGFDFEFYGNHYLGFYVQSSGVISFDPVAVSFDNQIIPNADEYNNMIAWMWTFMYPDKDAKVYYEQFDGFTVIQFVNYNVGWDGMVNAEVILHESGKIVIQYKGFSADVTQIHTVGIENSDGSIGTQASFNQYNYLHDEMAIEFSLGAPYPPVADAGKDQYLVGIEPVILDGSGSHDRDASDILSYEWRQVSGPTVELSDATAIKPEFIPEVKAEYVFELTVSDGVSASYPDEVLVVVGNRLPVAHAGFDKPVQIGSQVQLDGSGSYDLDPDNELSYFWKQVEGPVVVLVDSDTISPYFDCVEEGTYVFELVVGDGWGQSQSDTVKFVTIDMAVEIQDLDLRRFGTYVHYGDVSGDNVVYGVGSACDVTWIFKCMDVETGMMNNSNRNTIQPKIDGNNVVWFTYGDGWGAPWYHEPSNCNVFVRNIVTGAYKKLKEWSWADSYGHPVISGNKVVWVEHHNLDPNPRGSSEAENWWDTPYSICGADISNWDSPVFFTVDENVGKHDPYPCRNYSSDFDDIVDISGNIVVWEGDGDIYGADISDIENVKVFPICKSDGRQYDPAVSGDLVVWTDQRNDSGDIYGANISDKNNIEIYEVVKAAGVQQQAAIDGPLVVYVEGENYDEKIKFCCLTKYSGAYEIPLDKEYYGICPAVDGDTVVWQSDAYGEALGVKVELYYSIFDGIVQNVNAAKRYDYIQHAIDDAYAGEEIIVEPGIYRENVHFKGKNIVLRSVSPMDWGVVKSTVIKGDGKMAVVEFDGVEDSSCLIEGFMISGGFTEERGGGVAGNHTTAGIFSCIIKDNFAAFGGGVADCDGNVGRCIISNNTASENGGGIVMCAGNITNCIVYNNSAEHGGGLNNCDGVVLNCTVAGNSAEVDGGGLRRCDGVVSNCIVCSNTVDDVFECPNLTYCCYPGAEGVGNIACDPLFVDEEAGDSHLKSEGWLWDDNAQQWSWDEQTSPCVDAGNPGVSLGVEPMTLEVDPLNRWGENIRINMGAYGGTSEASMAPLGWSLLCDLTNDGEVGLADLTIFMSDWLKSGHGLSSDVSRDGVVNMEDYSLIAQEWLGKSGRSN